MIRIQILTKVVQTISQHVDTLKTHYYINKNIEDDDFFKYTNLIKSLLVLKKQSQETSNEYGDTKSINHFFGTHKFNIMPISIKGFSILLQNADCSIALRQSKNKVNPSPSIKVEFRAEFLARKGYMEAIKIINTLVETYILSSFNIKISEIHLATDIQGYNFSHLDFFKMKTRSRKSATFEDESIEAKASMFGGLTTFTGFTFGGGDYHLRIYNKSKEILSKRNKAFAETHLWEHKKNYQEDKTVWRIEIQIRRAKLKKMVSSNGNTLDNYYNILNNIPSLWNKALTDYNMKDFTEKQSFDLLRGKRTLKDGTDKPLTKYAIYKIFSRTETMPLWEEIKTWNGHHSSEINTSPKVPQIGNFMYVENSIKSLLSTMAKHYGFTSSQTMIQAFKQANINSLERNQVSLLEGTYNKQLDWIDIIDEHTASGVLNQPNYKDLESEIYTTIVQSDEQIRSTIFTDKILNRIEARKVFLRNDNEDVLVRDINYMQGLIDKTEAMRIF
ncbi:MAG: hypothetical protein ACJAWW_001619 [Sulfurimonas sp.]